MKGRVKICYDISEGKYDTVNVPFNMYVQGSYFGDSDVLCKDSYSIRDGTAIADSES